MSGAWIAVACATHVTRGRAGGYMQVCHGKGGPLARIKPGDRVAYYSPTTEMGGGAPCRAFTAIGTVRAREPYRFDMGGGFVPFRRDVEWLAGSVAEIRPLLDELELTRGRKNWGGAFRFGLVRVSDADMDRIAAAMGTRFG
ncbi:MAG: EVE domain-containing protein [Tagaea sp.]|nr:EVE domain-containing protein [Tagaea sp.]